MQGSANRFIIRISLIFACLGVGTAFYWISFLERVSVSGGHAAPIANPFVSTLMNISFPGINVSDYLHLSIVLWPVVNGLIYAVFGCLAGFCITKARFHRSEMHRKA